MPPANILNGKSKRMIRIRTLCLTALLAATTVPGIGLAQPPTSRDGETVFFAFDDHGIPWQHNLKLTLVQAKKHPANPVLRRGPKGAPDNGHAILYGTVIKDGDKFRMWYLGMIEADLKKFGDTTGHCATATLPKADEKRNVWVNVEGVSSAHPLTVELLDAQDRPLAGYSGANAAKIVQSGTRQLVEWPAQADRRAPSDTEFAIRVSFPESGDVRLYAVYVGP